MTTLVFGYHGQLASCLRALSESSENNYIFFPRTEVDIGDPKAVKQAFNNHSPKAAINAAAYTAVDAAEQHPEEAHRINHIGVKNLALAAAEHQLPLVHISTDYVFDGTKQTPYQTNDAVYPIGVYGQSKLLGEQVLRKYHQQHIILRTSWVFSEYGNNFVKTMLRLANERDELGIVNDQYGCPTYAGDIATTIVKMLAAVQDLTSPWGTYHYCGQPACTWYEFANAIFDTAKTFDPKLQIDTKAITTEAFPTPAKRPHYSVLNCQSTLRDWNLPACDWQTSLRKVLSTLYISNNH